MVEQPQSQRAVIWAVLSAWTLAVLVLAGCAGRTIRTDLSPAEKRRDLEYLAAEFVQRERSLTPETLALFDERVATIMAGVDSLSHDQFLIGIQWAVAAAGNGHTEALTHEHQRLRLPLDLHWFADGLYVIAARPGFEGLLSARVTRIEGSSPLELLEVLSAYTPGTEEHARVLSGYYLERPQLLAGIGRAKAADALDITFELVDGQVTTRRISGAARPSAARAADARRLLQNIDPLPLYLREPEKAVFLAWLPGMEAAYLRINRNDDKHLPRDLSDVLGEIDQRKPRHLIVDLRLNGGGNYDLTADFARALPGRIAEDGRLFIVVGHETFSAGIVTAAILKSRSDGRSVIVGERVGDSLTWWSEAERLVLPNSGLAIHCTDGFHDWKDGFRADDPRYRFNPRQAAMNRRYSAAAGSLEPDHSAALTFGDYAAGRDPAIEAIKAIVTGDRPLDTSRLDLPAP